MKTIFLALGLAAVGTLAQASAQSFTPGGYVAFDFPATTAAPGTRVISAPLLADSLYHGVVANVGTDTLAIADADWTAGQFTQTPAFVYITTGAQAGRTLAVVANTDTQLTVDVTDGGFAATNLDADGFALAAGDRFTVLPSLTLGSAFGTTAETAFLVGDAHYATADNVGLRDPVSGELETYYFNTKVGHWAKHGVTKKQDYTNQVIPPGAELVITRQPGRDATQLVLAGTVPATAPLIKLPGNYLARYLGTLLPVDLTLGQLDLGPNWRKANVSANADKLTVIKPGGAESTPYYQNKDGQWLKVDHDANEGATVLPAGGAVLFVKRKAVLSKDSFFPIPLPYTL